MLIILLSMLGQAIASMTDVNTILTQIVGVSDPNSLSVDERVSYVDKVKQLDKEILELSARVMSSQLVDTQNVALSNEHLKVRTIKASLNYFSSFLYQAPESLTASSPSIDTSYPNQLYDIVVQEYLTNVYKVFASFPYPEQSYPVIKTDILNVLDMQLHSPFQYLYDTNLTFPGDPYDDANSDELDEFMEQTRYLMCIVGNDTMWLPTCAQQTLIHPNGKVLIECNCYNLSSPIALINDTKYLYNKEDPVVITYVIVYRSAVLWVIIFISAIWFLFTISGMYKDHVTDVRQGKNGSPKRVTVRGKSVNTAAHIPRITLTKRVEFKIESDENDIIHTKEQVQPAVDQLQQDSRNNSLVIKFDNDEDQSKKRKKKLKLQSSPPAEAHKLNTSRDNSEVHGEPLNTLGDNTNRNILPKGHAKSEQQYFDEVMDKQQQEDNEDEDDDDDEDEEEYEDGSKKSNQNSGGEQISDIVVEHQHQHKQSFNKNNQDNKINVEIILDEKQIHQQDEDKGKNKDKKDEQKVVVIDKRPLPNVTTHIFIEIFLRYHELFSIFYYYKSKHSRGTRFIINYSKTMFILALCGLLTSMFNLLYNTLIMILGTLIANGIEQIATILTKQQKGLFKCMGYFVLLVMLGLSGYLYSTEFDQLTPDAHEVWLWTFVIVFLTEHLIIEAVVISLKIFLQPWLRRNNGDTSGLYTPLYAIFWDMKMQRLVRHQHKLHLHQQQQQQQQQL